MKRQKWHKTGIYSTNRMGIYKRPGVVVSYAPPQIAHLWISTLNQRESCIYSEFWFVYLCQLCLSL